MDSLLKRHSKSRYCSIATSSSPLDENAHASLQYADGSFPAKLLFLTLMSLKQPFAAQECGAFFLSFSADFTAAKGVPGLAGESGDNTESEFQ
mmetsp:Transcript_23042/g.31561  ORF Transcript_23042/g.31561 Transcript_23042/m.31561 type:complete len:93 (-) Transcript_23042:4444-4722(-)